MTGQLSLLDIPADPNYRTTDPETSRVAGKMVDRNRREADVLLAMRYASAPVDVHDIETLLARYDLCRQKSGWVASRLTSLERKGRVRRCGVKTGRYGRPTTLWALV